MSVPSSRFQRLWLPGFVFQSVMIGGGYATGRELVEFFLSAGPRAGLAGIAVAAAGFSIIAAVTFEFARWTRSHNYRSFFRALLGRWWFLFEAGYLALGMVVLAVLGAAAGELAAARLELHPLTGTVALIVMVCAMVYLGSAAIERLLAGWSALLYLTYALLIGCVASSTGVGILDALNEPAAAGDWLLGSFRYVGYSAAVIPVILFVSRHFQCRRDALSAGLLAGPLAMLPALLFYLAMLGAYPAVVASPVPADLLLEATGLGWLTALFYVVVFGTFAETGAAFVHALNERIHQVVSERGRSLGRWNRCAMAAVVLVISMFFATRVGLVELIAAGYGNLAYYFAAVFILPLLTIGLWRLFNQPDPGGAHAV